MLFEVGDYLVYGSNGVCKVDAVGPLEMSGAAKGLYYTLTPCYKKGSTIFTPVDNDKVLIRPVLTREEALTLIDEMAGTEALWINDEKRRELEYKAAVRKCDAKEFVRIIKNIYNKKAARQAEGKRLSASDERYFALAEDSLYGEIAIALDMSKEDARTYVISRVAQMDEQAESVC